LREKKPISHKARKDMIALTQQLLDATEILFFLSSFDFFTAFS